MKKGLRENYHDIESENTLRRELLWLRRGLRLVACCVWFSLSIDGLFAQSGSSSLSFHYDVLGEGYYETEEVTPEVPFDYTITIRALERFEEFEVGRNKKSMKQSLSSGDRPSPDHIEFVTDFSSDATLSWEAHLSSEGKLWYELTRDGRRVLADTIMEPDGWKGEITVPVVSGAFYRLEMVVSRGARHNSARGAVSID